MFELSVARKIVGFDLASHSETQRVVTAAELGSRRGRHPGYTKAERQASKKALTRDEYLELQERL